MLAANPGVTMGERVSLTRNAIRIVALGLCGSAVLGLSAAPVRAQVTPPVPPVQRADSGNAAARASATVIGIVYDSVHNAPLAGATVFLVGSPRIGVTTDRGAFMIDSVAAGSYRVHVTHDLLDSLGLAMVTDSFPVAEGERRVLEMAVPSGQTLVGLSCNPATRRLGPSAIIGRLLDADTDQPVGGARVSFAWSELSLAAGLKRVPKVLGATASADGVFRICGVPSEVEGTLQADKAGITTAEIKVTFIGQPLVIQGLRIGNANTVAKAVVDSSEGSVPRRSVGEQRFR